MWPWFDLEDGVGAITVTNPEEKWTGKNLNLELIYQDWWSSQWREFKKAKLGRRRRRRAVEMREKKKWQNGKA